MARAQNNSGRWHSSGNTSTTMTQQHHRYLANARLPASITPQACCRTRRRRLPLFFCRFARLDIGCSGSGGSRMVLRNGTILIPLLSQRLERVGRKLLFHSHKPVCTQLSHTAILQPPPFIHTTFYTCCNDQFSTLYTHVSPISYIRSSGEY